MFQSASKLLEKSWFAIQRAEQTTKMKRRNSLSIYLSVNTWLSTPYQDSRRSTLDTEFCLRLIIYLNQKLKLFQLAEAMVTLTQCLACTLGLSLVLSCAVSLAETSSSLIDHKHHFPDPHPNPNPYPDPDPDNTGSRVSDTLKFVVVVSIFR